MTRLSKDPINGFSFGLNGPINDTTRCRLPVATTSERRPSTPSGGTWSPVQPQRRRGRHDLALATPPTLSRIWTGLAAARVGVAPATTRAADRPARATNRAGATRGVAATATAVPVRVLLGVVALAVRVTATEVAEVHWSLLVGRSSWRGRLRGLESGAGRWARCPHDSSTLRDPCQSRREPSNRYWELSYSHRWAWPACSMEPLEALFMN